MNGVWLGVDKSEVSEEEGKDRHDTACSKGTNSPNNHHENILTVCQRDEFQEGNSFRTILLLFLTILIRPFIFLAPSSLFPLPWRLLLCTVWVLDNTFCLGLNNPLIRDLLDSIFYLILRDEWLFDLSVLSFTHSNLSKY